VSIVNGGENITLDLDVYGCPSIDQTTFLDGGKAYTLQSGTSTLLPYKNIKIKGTARDCGYAVGFDLPYALFDADGVAGIQGVEIDVVAEDCWRGVVLSGASATALLSESDRDATLNIKVTLINCAQNVIAARWVRANIDAHVVTTKTIAQLFQPFAADLSVYGADIRNDFKSKIRVTGRMLECDNKLVIGGATQGGGNSGACVQSQIDFEMEAATTNNDEINVINSGGNTVNNSIINLRGVTDSTGTDLIQDSNTVTFNAQQNTGEILARDLTVPRDGQAYDTFKAEANGDVFFLRAGSGSAGSADGFMFVKDTNTGATYRIQLYS
jgi:hypothetical protein